jgi:hypothetical protein
MTSQVPSTISLSLMTSQVPGTSLTLPASPTNAFAAGVLDRGHLGRRR